MTSTVLRSFKGKVVAVWPPRKFGNSFSIGFKIDTFDDYLNIYKPAEKDFPVLKKGMVAEGAYTAKSETQKNNVVTEVKAYWPVGQTEPPADLKPADEAVESLDFHIENNVILWDKIYNKLQVTSYYDKYKDNPEEIEKAVACLFIQIKRDHGAKW